MYPSCSGVATPTISISITVPTPIDSAVHEGKGISGIQVALDSTPVKKKLVGVERPKRKDLLKDWTNVRDGEFQIENN